MNVVIRDGQRERRLDEEQRWRLAGELAKTRSTHAGRGVFPKLEPDCTIVIEGNGWQETFEIYGRSVLRSVDTDETWQFHFGIVLLEWLYD